MHQGFLVVANEVGTDRIVGTFSLPSDGKVLDCVLADQSVLPMVCPLKRTLTGFITVLIMVKLL